jgi:chemotaxis protein CheC
LQNALNAGQTATLTEFINIAFGLTAAKLSEISGCRVLLDVPVIDVHPIHGLVRELGPFVSGPPVSVHQAFSGAISGDAVLFLNHDGAAALCNLFVEEHLRSQRLESSAAEILTEIGNILLGTCLGAFGNLLDVRVSFSIPKIHLDSTEAFLTVPSVDLGQLRHAVVISAPFHIREHGVEGRLVIVLGVSSLEQWTQAAGQWEYSQS